MDQTEIGLEDDFPSQKDLAQMLHGTGIFTYKAGLSF